MKQLSRNQTHYVIMTVIYDELTDFVIGNGNTFRDARDLICSICESSLDEVDPYILKTISLTLSNYGQIVKAYVPYLKKWKWERIPLLSQAILLMSYAHFYYVEKVDKKVVIDIAVNLAKKYIEEKQAKFINAILDEVIHD